MEIEVIAAKIEKLVFEISEMKTRYNFELGSREEKGTIKKEIEKLYSDIISIQQAFNGEKGLHVKLSNIDNRLDRMDNIINSVMKIIVGISIIVGGLIVAAFWDLIVKGNGGI